MSAWRSTTLGDILTLQRGFDITRAVQREGTTPVVSSSGVNSHHNVAMASGPGVVIGRKGTLGTAFYLDGPYWPHDTTLWVKDFKGNNPRFCYYLLKSLDLAKYDVGAANPTLNRNHLHLLQVAQPPISEQERIASILGAYDDLIELNRRRILLLEEMAQRLFDEWFARIWRGTCDALTEGWRVGVASDLIDFDPPMRLPRGSLKPFIPMGSLDTRTSFIDDIEEREAGSGAKFQNQDTLFARITPCLENGKTGLVRGLPGDGVGFGSTEFIVMRGRTSGPAFTYLLARYAPFRAHARSSMSGATGRQRARTNSLRSFKLRIPPPEVLGRFEDAARPMLEMVGCLGAANNALGTSRDHLLPRLISGELSVAINERGLEAAA